MSDDRLHNQDQEINRPLAELLSAYLDDRESLSSRELDHVELLLEQDADAQQAYAELRVVSQGLKSLDPVRAPRSYHLTAEMVGAPGPVAIQETPAWYARHAEKVRWATAAAAILFVFVLGADLVSNNILSDPSTDTNGTFGTNQAEMTSRDAGSDGAASDAAEPEAMEEEAGDDVAGDEAAPPAVTPESAEDADMAEDEAEESPPETSALEADPGEEEAATDGGEAESGDGADESAGNQQMLQTNQASSDAEDGDSARRLWRIAEFGLVVLLAVLITAMVILPRLGSDSSGNRAE